MFGNLPPKPANLVVGFRPCRFLRRAISGSADGLCAALREADVVWHDIVELSGRPRASEVTEIIELNLNLNEMETTVASFPLDGREDDFISGSDGEYSHTLYEAVLV